MRNTSLFVLACAVAMGQAPRFAVRPVAGSDWVGDNGPAYASLLLQAEGLAVGPDGSLYVSDAQTHRVRQIAPSGIIRTIAGTGVAGYSGDGGPAQGAQLSAPYGLAADGAGNLFIADLGNRRVRRVSRDGTISTVAREVVFQAPRNVAVDASGSLYVSDFGSGSVYKIAAGGTVSVLAILKYPAGLAVNRNGVLFIGETGTHQVRKLEGGVIRTVAAVPAATGLAFDAQDTLHIADSNGGGIFRVPAAGAAAPLALVARDVVAAPNGVLYSTDGRTIRRIVSSGHVVIAGQGDTARGDNGPAIEARLNNPVGLAFDATGNLFIADRNNHRVRRVDPDGIITTVAGIGIPSNEGDGGPAVAASLRSPSALSFDSAGNLYIATEDRVRMVAPNGRIALATGMPPPACIRLDLPVPSTCVLAWNGRYYAADPEADRVWELTPEVLPPPPSSTIAIVNAASRTGPLAPGMLAILEGATLDSPEVRFAGIPALTISPTTVVVPPNLAPGVVDTEIQGVGHLEVTVVRAAPALFVAVNEEGDVNDSAHPAARGSILVVYGTGQGVEPNSVAVRVGAYDAEVLYSGAVEGYPGLWQVNTRIPAGFLQPGTLPLTVSVGDAVTPPVTVEIK